MKYLIWIYTITRKYPLRGYILGVLTHTTAWDRLWGGDVSLRLYKHSSASLHSAAVMFWKSDHVFLKLSICRDDARTGATGAIAPVDFEKGLIAPVNFEEKFQISIGYISANFGPTELKFGLQRWEWNSWPEFAISSLILSKNSRGLMLPMSLQLKVTEESKILEIISLCNNFCYKNVVIYSW